MSVHLHYHGLHSIFEEFGYSIASNLSNNRLRGTQVMQNAHVSTLEKAVISEIH